MSRDGNPGQRAMKRRSIRWLSAIEQVCSILVAAREPVTALQRVLPYLVRELDMADAAIAWARISPGGQPVVRGASGLDLEPLQDLRLDAEGSVVGRVLETGKAVVHPPDGPVDRSTSICEEVFGVAIPGLDDASAAACVPLATAEARWGILAFLRRRPRSGFTRGELAFMRVVADLLAMVMERSSPGGASGRAGVSSSDEPYKTELISTLAHEMRTPLTTIRGYSTALLMEDVAFEPRAQREFLEIIDRECEVLEGLISDFLESSVIDAGTRKVELQPVRLPHLAARAVDEVRHRYPDHSLIIDFPAEFPLVDADPKLIAQVLHQLLDNAAKYSPGGGLVIVRGRTREDEALVSVADEGVGIAPEDLNRLFEKFFRARSSLHAPRIGTGLGLPISRAIVEAHGGRIWAESQPGEGSTFYFTLPLTGPSHDSAE